MNPFKSKIQCKHCSKFFRKKIEKGTPKFICGGYHNKTSHCANRKRIVIFESDLRELINRRYGRELSNEDIVTNVDIIKIEDKNLLEIHFKDRNEPILLQENYIQF